MTLQSGAGHTVKLQLGVRLIAEGTTSISGASDFSTFEIFNIGAPVPDASPVSMFPDSLWLSSNPTLRTTHRGTTLIMQVVD